MKANKAPEKIFLDEDESWHLTNPNGDSVEYTRTDAFIEKACEWLNNFYNGDTYSYLIDEDIEEFKNYMKGE